MNWMQQIDPYANFSPAPVWGDDCFCSGRGRDGMCRCERRALIRAAADIGRDLGHKKMPYLDNRAKPVFRVKARRQAVA